MPSVYLSPSLQEYNPYIDGGNEEYYMNLIADAMEPYLRASGIDFRRNDPDMTLSQAIADSNKGNHDLHLAIHSNAAPEGSAGRYTGADIYYYPTGSNGKRFAEILQKNYKDIYPEPNDVDIIPTTSLAEVRRTKSPSALIEVAYHDNPEDYVLTFCYSSKYAFKNNQIFRSYCSFHYISIRCSQHLKHIFLLILTVCPTANFNLFLYNFNIIHLNTAPGFLPGVLVFIGFSSSESQTVCDL